MSYTLSEYESKQLLAKAGIPVPPEHLVEDAESAVRAAEELGYPVVLKLCGRGIAHKTERDLVRLDLTGEAPVREAAQDLLGRRGPDEKDARLLVQPMVRGRRELIVGLVRDRQFGPCVMLGIGGIFAEALGDVAFGVAPLAPGDAEGMIDALVNRKILDAFRGAPPVDRAALARILEGVGSLGVDKDEVRSIDLNPLVIAGDTPVVVDALVEMEGDA
jgi:acetyl-CoA synthetase (ADP-forming)